MVDFVKIVLQLDISELEMDEAKLKIFAVTGDKAEKGTKNFAHVQKPTIYSLNKPPKRHKNSIRASK